MRRCGLVDFTDCQAGSLRTSLSLTVTAWAAPAPLSAAAGRASGCNRAL